jgi:hypothetical protein
LFFLASATLGLGYGFAGCGCATLQTRALIAGAEQDVDKQKPERALRHLLHRILQVDSGKLIGSLARNLNMSILSLVYSEFGG